MFSTATCQRTLPERARFQEIDVERINVLDTESRQRLVIANSERQADSVIDGTVIAPGRDRPAGMIFFNEEGSEVGGLVFHGRRDNGLTQAGGVLTFDRYNQAETVQLLYAEDGSGHQAGLRIMERPETSLAVVADLAAERERASDAEARAAIEREMMARMGVAAERAFVGRLYDGNAKLVLSDSESRPRLVLTVTPDGRGSIQFLDAEGRAVRSIGP
jgi:hypothetical protein